MTCAGAGPSSGPGSRTWIRRNVSACTGSGRRRSRGRSTGWRNSVDQRVLGEFMGTMVLLLLGNGVVANVLLRKSKAEGAGWMVITAGWAFGVMCGVFTAMAVGSPDAHLNPAVTIGAAVNTGDWSKLVPYSIAQVLGAMAGQTLVWLYFLPHWQETPDAGAKLACFSTGPAIRNIPCNLLCEVIGTFI